MLFLWDFDRNRRNLSWTSGKSLVTWQIHYILQQLFVVVDTNVLMHSVKYIDELKDQRIQGNITWHVLLRMSF